MQEALSNKSTQLLTQFSQLLRYIVVRLGKIILKAAKKEDISQNVDKLGYHCQTLQQLIRRKTIQQQQQERIKKYFKHKTESNLKEFENRNNFCNKVLQYIKCYQKQYVDQFLFKLMKEFLSDSENIVLQYKVDGSESKMLKKIYNAIVKCLHVVLDGSFDFSHNLFVPFNLIGKNISSLQKKSVFIQRRQQIITDLKLNSLRQCTRQSKEAFKLFKSLNIDQEHFTNTIFQAKIKSNSNLVRNCIERNKNNFKTVHSYKESFIKYKNPKESKMRALKTINMQRAQNYFKDNMKANQNLQRQINKLEKNNSYSETRYLEKQLSNYPKRTLSISLNKEEKKSSVSFDKGYQKRNVYNINSVLMTGSNLSIQLDRQERVLAHKQVINNTTAFLLRGFQSSKKKILERYRFAQENIKRI